MPDPSPELRWTAGPAWARAVVLVLPGGSEHSKRSARWRDTAVLRMLPVARAAADAGRGGYAVARLRYAVRGWNERASPVADARAALVEIGDRFPGVPVAVVGHSMGGRVALTLAGDERVDAVIALAPWVGPDDQPRHHQGVRVLVVHGLRDRITSPDASRSAVERLRELGVRASYIALRTEGHAMLLRAKAWDLIVHGFLRAALDPSPDTETHPYAVLGARAAREDLLETV